MTRTLLFSVLVSLAAIACAPDPEAACGELCRGSGFDSGNADVEENETNCFCNDGTGTVEDVECESMCTGLGFGTSQVFGQSAAATADACQCSP